MPLSSCPVCGGRSFKAAVSAAAVQREIRERDDFVYSRLRRRASPAELKDLTDFMHGAATPLVTCSTCSLLLRNEPQVEAADSYEEDPNDPDLMAHVYRRYVDFFRKKKDAMADRLPPGASVLEIGPHLGGFLQAAEEWNWSPIGLDIGKDTSEFTRRLGLTVRRERIEDTRVPASSADAIFIWNCFEQLAEPAPALEAAYRLLRPFGLLVLRIPNAAFYLEHRGSHEDWLAWNNLLGFPYLYGYTDRTLNRIAAEHGFEPVRGFNSELLTMPFPDLASAVAAEQKSTSEAVARHSSRTTSERGKFTGPWIEVIYRKMSEVQRRRPRLDLRFLERAA
jgi:SAM-dependent methyltransferase